MVAPRHPRSAPGDWYVEDGCCTLCGVPWDIAPELFDTVPEPPSHCFVKRQPQTTEELMAMLEVVAHAELECIRYAGRSPILQRALRQRDQGHLIDHPRRGLRARLQRWLRRSGA